MTILMVYSEYTTIPFDDKSVTVFLVNDFLIFHPPSQLPPLHFPHAIALLAIPDIWSGDFVCVTAEHEIFVYPASPSSPLGGALFSLIFRPSSGIFLFSLAAQRVLVGHLRIFSPISFSLRLQRADCVLIMTILRRYYSIAPLCHFPSLSIHFPPFFSSLASPSHVSNFLHLCAFCASLVEIVFHSHREQKTCHVFLSILMKSRQGSFFHVF